MAKTDLESFIGHRSSCHNDNMVREIEETVLDKSNDSTIHSGHFMVSCIHEDPDTGEAKSPPTSKDDEKQDQIEIYEQGFDFDSAIKEPTKSYNFGNRSTNTSAIDASLTKLFECMTLAYRLVYCSQQLLF